MEAVEQEGEVGGGLRCKAEVLEAYVFGQDLGRLPAVAEGRIGHDSVKLRLPGGIRLAEKIPVVRERVAVEYLELRVLHPVQQHVHAREVVGRDVLLLPVDPADRATGLPQLVSHIEKQ